MPFDPDAYLEKNKPSDSGFDPDAYLAKNAPKPEVSKLESFVRGSVQGLTGNFSDEMEAGSRSAEMRGGILGFDPMRDPAVAKERGIEVEPREDYDTALNEIRQENTSARESNPGTYFGGEMAGAVGTALVPGLGAAKGASLGKLAARGATEGAIYGAGAAEGDITDRLKGAATGGTIGAVLPVGLRGVSKTAGKVGDVIGDSKFGQAFKKGEAVRKFNDPEQQTDLANRLLSSADGALGDTYQAQAAARKKFANEMGNEVVDTAPILDDLAQFAGRHGDEVADFGKLTAGEAKKIGRYTEALQEPQDAKTLYAMWDDINRIKTTFEANLNGNTTEYSKRLGQLMKGIKSITWNE